MYHAYYLYIPAGAIWLLWLIWKFIFSTKNNSGKQIFLSSIFYMYIVLVLGITLFPIPIDVSQTQSIISFIPLKTVMPLFSLDSSPFIQYILSTLVLFIPFGLLTPFFLKSHALLKTTLFTVLFAVIIEALQYFIGAFALNSIYTNISIDDILFSVLGSAVGFIIFSIIPFSVKNQFVRNSRKLRMQVYRPEIVLTKRP